MWLEDCRGFQGAPTAPGVNPLVAGSQEGPGNSVVGDTKDSCCLFTILTKYCDKQLDCICVCHMKSTLSVNFLRRWNQQMNEWVSEWMNEWLGTMHCACESRMFSHPVNIYWMSIVCSFHVRCWGWKADSERTLLWKVLLEVISHGWEGHLLWGEQYEQRHRDKRKGEQIKQASK